jgi:Flp pilus assembly pilin Flp
MTLNTAHLAESGTAISHATSSSRGGLRSMQRIHEDEEGLATAEYGIVMLAAVGSAGLLVTILSSGAVQGFLNGLIERALTP